MEHLNKLVFGKAEQTGIVSIEPLEDQTLLFLNNGEQIAVPNRFWILANKSYSIAKWRKMAGNQFFQYGLQFSSREEFERTRSFLNSKYGDQNFYSIWDKKEAFMVNFGHTYYKGTELNDVSILSFDIETTSLEWTPKDKILLISNTYRKGNKIVKKLFAYDEYDSQVEMLSDWCSWVREMNPSILCGHNIISFDLVYLNACARYHDSFLELGRDGSALEFARYESRFRKDQTQFLMYKKPRIFGREVCDTYFLSIKYDVVLKKYDSYGLKQIIKAEGMEDPNRVFYEANQIRHKYKIVSEWEKIKAYCIDDSDDSLKLFDLMAPSYFYLARSVPKSFQEIICGATGSQLNSMFVRSYLQDGHSIPKASEAAKFPGAISWGNPGIYSNCIKWDVASLYPSIMLQYEIYPTDKDPKRHFLQILQYFTHERLLNKKLAGEKKSKYHKDLSESQKIVINSAYGMLGTNGINFNSPEQAARVTELGREVLQKAIQWATGKTYEEWNPKQEETNEETEEAG